MVEGELVRSQYKDWKRTADGYIVDGKLVPGDDGEVDSWDLCNKCHAYGHRGPRCKNGKLPSGEKTKITPQERGDKLPKTRRGGGRGGGTRRRGHGGGDSAKLLKTVNAVIKDVAAVVKWGGMDSSALGDDSAVRTIVDQKEVAAVPVSYTHLTLPTNREV